MKVNQEICEVIAEIEYLIGSECYNPNSYDGWNDIEGCDFRYPITVPNGNGEFFKTRSNINRLSALYQQVRVSPDTVKFMKYRFGSNELFVGRGIIRALEYLEKRYGLDFNELEEKYQNENDD